MVEGVVEISCALNQALMGEWIVTSNTDSLVSSVASSMGQPARSEVLYLCIIEHADGRVIIVVTWLKLCVLNYVEHYCRGRRQLDRQLASTACAPTLIIQQSPAYSYPMHTY